MVVETQRHKSPRTFWQSSAAWQGGHSFTGGAGGGRFKTAPVTKALADLPTGPIGGGGGRGVGMSPAWIAVSSWQRLSASHHLPFVFSLNLCPLQVVVPIGLSPPGALDRPVLPILTSPHSLPVHWEVV